MVRCYETSEENQYIIFEDLLARNYKLAPKKVGLDVQHYKRVLVKVAKWHAVTVVLQESVRKNVSLNHCIFLPFRISSPELSTFVQRIQYSLYGYDNIVASYGPRCHGNISTIPENKAGLRKTGR